VYVCASVHVCLCVCVFVCVRERMREKVYVAKDIASVFEVNN